MPWIRNRFQSAPKKSKNRRTKNVRALLEALESRQLLSVDVVTNFADSGAGSLRQAIADAASGDTIQFDSSLSGETISLSGNQLTLNKSLTIVGLGASNLTISGSSLSTVFNIASGANVAISAITITSGNCGNPNNGGDIYNSGTLNLSNVTVTQGRAEIGAGLYNNGGNVTISGSTFSLSTASEQGGGILNAPGGVMNITGTTFIYDTSGEEAGGAICNESASLSLTGCSFTFNTAGSYGGAIANLSGGTLVINSTAISNNTADFWGGGIFNFTGASLTIGNASLISANQADGTFGGGLFNDQGTASISATTFNKNTINDTNGGVGAAISSFSGTLNITSSTFTNNGNTTTVLAGGAVYTDDVSASISSSSFKNNKAQYGAGIYQDTGGQLAVTNTAFEKNTAVSYGGAAYLSGTSYFSNSTIAGNQAQYGGGIISFGTLTLANCTLSTNVATVTSVAGAGLYVDQEDTTIYNTIVAGNTLSNLSTPSDITGTLDVGLPSGHAPSSNNLIGTGGSGGLTNGVNGNKVGFSAGLGPAQNNGGPTDTMALQSNSVAINAGNNTLALDASGHLLATDQRGLGFARIVNGTVDIGAYELQSIPAVSFPAVTASPSPLVPSGHLPAIPAIPRAGTSVPGFAGLTAVSLASAPYTPAEIRGAYGVNDIFFNGTTGTGSGQTIAIIDAFNDPNIIADANTFSSDFGLPQFNAGGPTLQVLNENGGTTLPANSTPGQWDIEISLDVEWAHAMAPNANIILFEAASASNTDLDTAVSTATNTPAVSVVSMSYLSFQLLDSVSGVNESTTDSVFTTPIGHQGITFLAATGDQGAPGLGYPAASPNVVAVGGTTLLVGSDNSYIGESAWSGGGGGISLQASQPSYQSGNVNGITSSARTTPDVSLVADPQTGVFVLDSFAGGGFGVGGTSLATPLWAGLIAIADQGLALRGQSSLNGSTQTLPDLYNLPAADFHDITTGDNGYPAGAGYDLATGRGTPIANLLVPALAGFPGTAVWTGLQSNNWFNPNNWNTFSVPNANTNVIINFGDPVAATPIDIAGLTINGGLLQFGLNGGGSIITSLSITGNGTIDLTNNHLFIDFGAASDPNALIALYLTSGYNGGAWTGTGIDSSAAAATPSYALGYGDGADGVVAGLTAGQIEIAYTLYGDANLDYSVNGADFAILSSNFNKAVTGWDQGDFNYDGAANGADFAMLTSNFNKAASGTAIITSAPASSILIADANDSTTAGDSPATTSTPAAPVPPTSPVSKTIKKSAAANISSKKQKAPAHHGKSKVS